MAEDKTKRDTGASEEEPPLTDEGNLKTQLIFAMKLKYFDFVAKSFNVLIEYYNYISKKNSTTACTLDVNTE